ncbi:hypothetical protein L198_06487 [Cryptococcus wingfieldii CBS 7118]|uniref:Uncharacterized protein n=1 Tax=Cryptococcus wingfieldii CBS 7118 TaxID=1295528 RepID=A0A1E3IL49_9TREE|nr:hypothetical protein L198_06487 [Cryptococcus wingfieldii CBS 7118]ODN89165.1 hypothetical protein L198_06487 [Cryptococcus wingfieldii CBS 7118]
MIPFIVHGIVTVWTAIAVYQMDIIHQNHFAIMADAFFHPALPIIPLLIVYSISAPSVYKVPELPSASFTSASSVSLGWPAFPTPDGGALQPFLTYTEDGELLNTVASGPGAAKIMAEQLIHLTGAVVVSFLALLGGMKRVLNEHIGQAINELKASFAEGCRRYKVALEFYETLKGELVRTMSFRYLRFFKDLQPPAPPTPEFGVHVPRHAPIRRALLCHPPGHVSLESAVVVKISWPQNFLGRWSLQTSLGAPVSPPRLILGPSLPSAPAAQSTEKDRSITKDSTSSSSVLEANRESSSPVNDLLELSCQADDPSNPSRSPGDTELIHEAKVNLECRMERQASVGREVKERAHSTIDNTDTRQKTYTGPPADSSPSSDTSTSTTIDSNIGNTELPSTGNPPPRPIGEGTPEEADSSTGPQPSHPIGDDSTSSQASSDAVSTKIDTRAHTAGTGDVAENTGDERATSGPDPRHPIEVAPPFASAPSSSSSSISSPSPDDEPTRPGSNSDSDDGDDGDATEESSGPQATDTARAAESSRAPPVLVAPISYPENSGVQRMPGYWPIRHNTTRFSDSLPRRIRSSYQRHSHPRSIHDTYRAAARRPSSRRFTTPRNINSSSGDVRSSLLDRYTSIPRILRHEHRRVSRLGPHDMEEVQPAPVEEAIDEMGERLPQQIHPPSYERFDSNPAPPYFGYSEGHLDPDPPPLYHHHVPRNDMLAQHGREDPLDRAGLGEIEHHASAMALDNRVLGWLQQQNIQRATGRMDNDVAGWPAHNPYDHLPAPFFQGEPVALPSQLQDPAVTVYQNMNAGHVVPESYARQIVREEIPPQDAVPPLQDVLNQEKQGHIDLLK